MSMLLNALLQGIILTALVWALLKLIPRLNASTRCAAWCVTLLAVVLLPLPPLLRSLSMNAGQPADQSQPLAGGISKLPFGSASATPGLSPLADQSRHHSISSPGDGASSVSGNGYGWRPIQLAAGPAWVGVLYVWGLASSILLIRLAVGYRFLIRLKHQARAVSPQLQDRMDFLVARAAVSRSARLLMSDHVAAPVALGLFRPMILIPASLPMRIDQDDIDHVLLHELAHLRRYDDWVNLFQRLLEALFPIQPAIFWIGRQIGLEREAACDNWVVQATGAPKPYAATLTRVAEYALWVRSGILASGVAGHPSQLYQRVHRLLDKRHNLMPRVRAIHLAALTSVIGLLSCMSIHAPPVVALSEPATNPSSGNSAPTSDDASPADPGTVSRSFTVAEDDKLAMNIDRGNVHVGVWDNKTVQITVRQTGPDLDEFLKHHTIDIRQDGREVRVRAWGDAWLSSASPQVKIEYDVMIPAKLGGTIGSALGNIDLTGTAGKFAVNTSLGNLHFTNTPGPIVASSDQGNIDAADCQNTFEASVQKGNIDFKAFTGPSITAETAMGNVTADLAGQIKSNSSISTAMGNLKVTIPSTAALNLSIASRMGNVNSDFNSGPMNGGGPALDIATAMGNINVRKR